MMISLELVLKEYLSSFIVCFPSNEEEHLKAFHITYFQDSTNLLIYHAQLLTIFPEQYTQESHKMYLFIIHSLDLLLITQNQQV